MMEGLLYRARGWLPDTLSSGIGRPVLPVLGGWIDIDGGSAKSSGTNSDNSDNGGKVFGKQSTVKCSWSVVVVAIAGFTALLALSYLAFTASGPANSLIWSSIDMLYQEDDDSSYVVNILEAAANENRTVIMTTMNAAWTKAHSMLGMFVDGIKAGDGTKALLSNIVVVCFDRVAYKHCIHMASNERPSFHCLQLRTRGVDFSGEELYLTHDYILMMWRRIQFLTHVLHMGYNFVFTDADVLWLRNPFPMLLNDEEADFQVACDFYNGNPFDINNYPNAGFVFVRANNKTIDFYKYWYHERNRGNKMADQEVFNVIKYDEKFNDIGMRIRFLDTQFFGGFCAIETSDMTKAITMHATCCKGLEAKLIDLRMILNHWKEWKQVSLEMLGRFGNETSAPTMYTNSLVALSPTSDINKIKNDPNFTLPLACPQSWHKK